MNSAGKNMCFLLIAMIIILISEQKSLAQAMVHLFPDKNYCVSGDTLWFNTILLPDNNIKIGNVIHVQFDGLQKQHILKVSIVCENNRGQGYLTIPDSLSSGVYILKAYLSTINSQQNSIVNQRMITVYNRFDKNLKGLKMPLLNNRVDFENDPEIHITTEKSDFKSRETVQVKIELPEKYCSDLTNLIITSGIIDPFSKEFSSFYIPDKILRQNIPLIALNENNGILISGKVSSLNNSFVPGAIVLLSIPDSIPYFDYCISDSEGYFFFYLKNAKGTGSLVIQAISSSEKNCIVELNENYIETNGISDILEKSFEFNEKTFVTDLIDASYYNRLFIDYNPSKTDFFSMPSSFDFPFYGKPTKTIYMEEFVDLPDLAEISRELLPGVEVRQRKDTIKVRLFDSENNVQFQGEPLILLDGIPVFDPLIISTMGTKDIKKIEVVLNKRFFGDLAFNGVLAFYSNNKTTDWFESIPGAGIYKYSCLQPESNQYYSNQIGTKNNIPDLRKSFFNDRIDNIKPEIKFNFLTSDISGKAAIRIIAVTKQNKILYAEKIIEIE